MSIRPRRNSPCHRRRWAGVVATCLLAVLTLVPAAVGQTRPDDVPAALIVRFDGPVGTAGVALLQRAISTVKGNGSQYLVLEIDSTMSSPDEIQAAAQLVDDLHDDDLSVVAFIAETAFPAAAILALSCDQVYMRRGAQIGGGTAMAADFTALRQAMVAAIADRPRDSAGRRLLVQAMVDKEMVLWEATYRDDSPAGSGLEQTSIIEEARLLKMQDNPQIHFVVPPQKFETQPLTLRASRAEALGLIDGVVDTVEIAITERLGLDSSQIGRLEPNWSEDTVSWLNSMREVLYVLGFILLLIEFKTPGFALPGALGVMMFGLAFFGSYMVGLATITEVLLFFLGLGLLAVEIYVMPGMIVFGLAGFLCIVAGLIFSQQDFYLPSTEAQSQYLLNNLINFGLVMLAVMGGIWAVYANLSRIPLLKHAVQRPPDFHELGAGPSSAYDTELNHLAGQEGVLATDLRPTGVMSIGDERYDVLSEGNFVEKGSRVRVIEVHGNRVVVEPVEPVETGDPQGGEVTIALLALMVLVGLALVVAEVFFVSAGLLAVLAGVLLVSAVFFAFSHHDAITGYAFLTTCAIGVPAAVKLAFQVLPHTSLGRQLYLAGSDPTEVSGAAQEDGIEGLLGQTGTALCDLRPAGYAKIGGKRIDVVTRGELVEKSKPIKVIRIESNQVFVALEHK